MDAHYSKVMKAREEVTETSNKLYFAYSGVLDIEAFDQWRTEHSYQFFELPEGRLARAENIDLIFDFPSRWWGGRVAGLTEKPGAYVYGKVFEIPSKNWPVVQHKEGVITGMSIEKEITVLVDNKPVTAVAFTTNPLRTSLQGTVSQDYLEALIRGAKSSHLPEEYITTLINKFKNPELL